MESDELDLTLLRMRGGSECVPIFVVLGSEVTEEEREGVIGGVIE